MSNRIQYYTIQYNTMTESLNTEEYTKIKEDPTKQ